MLLRLILCFNDVSFAVIFYCNVHTNLCKIIANFVKRYLPKKDITS